MDALHQRIAYRFARVEVRECARRYLVGLLDRVERKHGWQLAKAIGACGAKGAQRQPRRLCRVDSDGHVVRRAAEKLGNSLALFCLPGSLSCAWD